jgi:pyruvate dehydrogenase E2 component (dihydrolipoamide acetyltransferase)
MFRSPGERVDILMPQLGETLAEGKITLWFKAIGDEVSPGDNLFEIETDKVSMEVPATAAGTITHIHVAAGEVAPVGAVVGVMAAGAEAEAEAEVASSEAGLPLVDGIDERARLAIPSPARGGGLGRGQLHGTDERPLPQSSFPRGATLSHSDSGARTEDKATPLDPFHEVRTPPRNYGPAKLASGTVVTPLARRLAGEARIDLNRIAPSRSQAGGIRRIVADDVMAAIAAHGRDQTPVPSPERVKLLFEPGIYEDVPLDPIRRTIAARLGEAARIPQFHLTMDIATDRLEALCQEANAAISPERSGVGAVRLTINDFIVKALALALMRVPAANAVWAEDRILRFMRADVGVAMSIDGGLVTPVVRGVEKKSLIAISTEIRDFATRARTRRLNPAELQGGASAVSNLGMHGVREFSAILNPPQATILAVGAAARRPVEATDGSVRFAGQMTATLTCDHRVIDGALGAELLGAIRHLIEHPVGMMM